MSEQKKQEQQQQPEPQQEYQLKYFKLDVSQLARLIHKDLKASSEGTALLSQYNKKDIMEYLQSPISSEKTLRRISRLLYNLSPQYKRLLRYFTDMARFDYVVDIINPKLFTQTKEQILKKYSKTIVSLDKMNIKHEFAKISKTCFVEDVFYGYDYATDDSYMIQKLDPDYCKLSGYADSVRTFKFDFSYFKSSNISELETNFAPEFKEKYQIFKADKTQRWQELSVNRSVCIKLSEEIDYPIPFFASLFPDIFDIHDYKLMKKAKTEMENYVILVAKIPYLKNSDMANAFALDNDNAVRFANEATGVLPEQVGFILSPYEDVNAIYLANKAQNESDSVAEAEQSFFNSAGVNQALFNSDKISEESIRKSIKADENLVYGLYRQLERWLNRKMKLGDDYNFKSDGEDFKARILNTTEFNYIELAKAYKENAIYGIPVKRELCAALGQTPMEMECAINMETLLNLEERFKPLTSSNTMSPDSVNGRPAQETGGSADTGKQLGDNE